MPDQQDVQSRPDEVGADYPMTEQAVPSFSAALIQELIKSLPNNYGSNNWDSEALPYNRSREDWISATVQALNGHLGKYLVAVRQRDIDRLLGGVSKIQDSIDGLASLYGLLQDDYSKRLLVRLTAYRIMGYRKVKLPLNTASYWAMRKSAHDLITGPETIPLKFRDFTLRRMSLGKIGFPIELFYLPGGAAVTFILKQYEYRKTTPVIKARVGDCIIDAGGCWGDTALYFAHCVGAQGRVWAFEFDSGNLEVLWRNLSLNPGLAERISVIPKALWDHSDEDLSYADNGPATRLNDNQGPCCAQTVSLDDFVREEKLARVDFIKMDIEGAELKALQGAEATLRAFKPRLAISVYHKPEDWVTIPNYLHQLGVGYRFFLDHFTIYHGETILFAHVADDPA